MDVYIKINADNAAFADCGTGPEVARILRQLAEDVDFCDIGPSDGRRLLDVNGNACGEFEITE